jgi:hypothetical protein
MNKMKIELTNETLMSYVRTDDAIEAFNNTAEAGQTRLSLQVLVEVIDGLVSKIEELEEKIENFSSAKIEIVEPEIKPVVKVKESPSEKPQTVEEEKDSKVKV